MHQTEISFSFRYQMNNKVQTETNERRRDRVQN
jgi:hypothetical protein